MPGCIQHQRPGLPYLSVKCGSLPDKPINRLCDEIEPVDLARDHKNWSHRMLKRMEYIVWLGWALIRLPFYLVAALGMMAAMVGVQCVIAVRAERKPIKLDRSAAITANNIGNLST